MWRIILRRILLSIPLVLVVTSLTFGMINLLPGNAAESLIGTNGTREQIVQLTREFGLDRPVWEQWWIWAKGVAQGDLGHSLTTREPVLSMLRFRIGVTLPLALGALVASALVGIVIGVLTAQGSHRLVRLIDALFLLGYAVPPFWLALVLIFFFAVKLQWLPAVGYAPFSETPLLWAASLVLPMMSLAIHLITVFAKQTRDSMMDVLASPFIFALRANGLSEYSIVYKHALRNAAIPVVTMIGVSFIGLLTGTVVVESIFALPGLGAAAVYATSVADIPMIQGIALVLTLCVVGVNVLTDVAYALINPKVRAR